MRPPAICCARAGSAVSALVNALASKVIVPSLVSWMPMEAGEADPVGLADSSFAQMRTPGFGLRRGSSTSGVLPIDCTMSP